MDFEPKGRQFNSQSGHMPGPSGGHVRGTLTLMFLSLSFSLPPLSTGRIYFLAFATPSGALLGSQWVSHCWALSSGPCDYLGPFRSSAHPVQFTLFKWKVT